MTNPSTKIALKRTMLAVFSEPVKSFGLINLEPLENEQCAERGSSNL